LCRGANGCFFGDDDDDELARNRRRNLAIQHDMPGFLKTALAILAFVAVGGGLAWLLRAALRRSDDPRRLTVQWLVTGGVVTFLLLYLGPMMSRDGGDSFVGNFGAAVFAGGLLGITGLVLALVWSPSIVEGIGRKFGQLYDGGDTAPDPEPFFSIAEARRKQGRYAEAEAEVRKQLEMFPTHFCGQMLLAEIQAQDLRDLAATTATIEQILQQPGHAPKNVAFALTRLADWHLKYADDREAARAALERIVALMPDTPESHLAWQRLAHLTPESMLDESRERPRLAVPEAPPRLGVLTEAPIIKRKGSDPQERAAELVAQLDQFPNDNQTREELALLYAVDFQRADLAAEQLEQLIAQPHAPAAQIARWLNLLADLRVSASDLAGAKQALERVIERDPASAAAEQARRRLTTLNLEARAKKESQVVPLGSYEQKLGLKGGPYRA
jgi:hypothetical protein